MKVITEPDGDDPAVRRGSSASKEVLETMHRAQYILHARGDQLTRFQ